jgi:hypothetical protein
MCETKRKKNHVVNSRASDYVFIVVFLGCPKQPILAPLRIILSSFYVLLTKRFHRPIRRRWEVRPGKTSANLVVPIMDTEAFWLAAPRGIGAGGRCGEAILLQGVIQAGKDSLWVPEHFVAV